MPSAEAVALDAGWTAGAAAPGEAPTAWIAATVPGTAAGALRAAGAWSVGDDRDLDQEDWWFRCTFTAAACAPDEEVVLRFDGLATLCEVRLDGAVVLDSTSMWARHEVAVGSLLRKDGEHELEIRCAALGPVVRRPRRPRARWRTRLAAHGLRFHRTLLLGRMPGVAPRPAAVGPWRPVTLERRSGVVCDAARLLPRVEAADGVLAVDLTLRGVGPAALPATVEVRLDGPSGAHAATLAVDGGHARGELRVPGVARWWPHTHGAPVLHEVTVVAGDDTLLTRRAGFRAFAPGPSADHDVERDGLDLRLNGVAVFARGPIWTTSDAVGLAPSPAELRARLELVRDAGMNLVRVAGTGLYESDLFHDLCDELGLLVWQDMMFANFDYPIEEPAFRDAVEREAAQVLGALAGRPSLVVVCGSSEVEQQVAMLGLDPSLGRSALQTEVLPDALTASGADAVWVPSAPCGGPYPFRADRGVANYFGVGAYGRPLGEARRAGVRFASECLAWANVPDEDVIAEAGLDGGVIADAGTTWDFRDVDDHYLRALYGVDPGVLRRRDPERYLELSRAVTGELSAEVLGEWRRAASPCGGAVVLWLGDLVPGSGWGFLDHRGRPKVAWHHLARALAPVAVWTTDEQLNGIAAHVANDGPDPLRAVLRVAMHLHEEVVAAASVTIEVAPHTTVEHDVEAVLGHFHDVSQAYLFGPPTHDVVVVTLEDADGAMLSQSLRFPHGRPLEPRPAAELGVELAGEEDGDVARVVVRSRRVLFGVRVHAPGWIADDAGFAVAPGGERVVTLRPVVDDARWTGAAVTALNLAGRVTTA